MPSHVNVHSLSSAFGQVDTSDDSQTASEMASADFPASSAKDDEHVSQRERRPSAERVMQAFLREPSSHAVPASVSAKAKIASNVEKAIISDVRMNLQCFDRGKTSALGTNTKPLKRDHVVMGLFFDALYRHHFQSNFEAGKIDLIPHDDDLRKILTACLHRTGFGEDFLHFAPNMKETTEKIFLTLSTYPHFANVSSLELAHCVVDRQKIRMLAEHGIDVSNPFLMFIFDAHPGFAHSTARGWLAIADSVSKKEKFGAPLVHKVAAEIGVGELAASGSYTGFGAVFTKEGIESLSERMLRFQKMGKSSGARIGSKLIFCTARARNIEIANADLSLPGGLPQAIKKGMRERKATEASLRDIMMTELEKEVGNSADGCAVNVLSFHHDHEVSLNILSQIAENYDSDLEKAVTKKEKLTAATTVYLDGEHLHLYRDANFRLFGKCILNFLLMHQGEGFHDIYDPNVSDGQSPAQVAEDLLVTNR